MISDTSTEPAEASPPPPPPPGGSMRGAMRSTLIVTAFTGSGIVLSFLSNVIVAAKFGSGPDMDVYFAATSLPLFLSGIITSALGSTFIPVLNDYRNRSLSDARTMVNTMLNAMLLLCSILCIAGIIGAGPLIRVMAPGFSADKAEAAAILLRWLLPVVVLSGCNELLSGLYFSHKRFSVPMIIRVLGPLITLAYVFAFASTVSTLSLVLATLTTTLLQTVILAVGLVRAGQLVYTPTLALKHPGCVKIFLLMAPLVAGLLVYRIVPLFDRWLASGLPDGSISTLGYSTRLLSVIQPIITSGIAVTFLTLMSELAARKDMPEFRATIEKGLRMLLFISVPIAVLLGVCGMPVVQLLFERGAFTHQDTILTYRVFAIYLISLPFASVGTILGQGYYALQDTKTPAMIGVVEAVAYMGLCVLLMPYLRLYTIPAVYALYFFLSVLINAFVLGVKIQQPVIPMLAKPFLHQSLSALIGLGLVLSLNHILPATPVFQITNLGLGAAAYFLTELLLFKSAEARMLAGTLTAKFRALLSR